MSQPSDAERPRRLVHFTPLRYPGGKGKLAGYVKRLIKANRLLDGEYVEPYAGGAAIALELLLHEYVSRVRINDVSRPVYAFWRSVLFHTEEFCKLVSDTPRTVEVWRRHKAVLMSPGEHDDLTLGFAAFFLNRTNRSGILNGGVIGGLDQSGPWKIDARYNAPELIHRIQSIAKMGNRIDLTMMDALPFLEAGISRWPDKTLIYLDPPYYVKGRELYYDYYKGVDHERIANFVTQHIVKQKWIVSYDNVQSVREMYPEAPFITYDISYSARRARQGKEIMFFADSLCIPPLGGAMNPTEEQTGLFT